MLDLAGYPKDDAFWWQSQFLPRTPTVRLVPGSWEAQPPWKTARTPLATERCAPGTPGQAFDFAELPAGARAGAGSGGVAMRSRTDPTRCVSYSPAVLDRQHWAVMTPCAAGDPNQRFSWDAPATPNRLVWTNASNPSHTKCLDLFGGVDYFDARIDFFDCLGSGRNQEWNYTAESGALRPVAPAPGKTTGCVADGESRPVWVYVP